jgi:hypothetical protein
MWLAGSNRKSEAPRCGNPKRRVAEIRSAALRKSEAPRCGNPKHEIRNPKQSQNSYNQNILSVLNFGFGSLEFVSDFVLRISDFSDYEPQNIT